MFQKISAPKKFKDFFKRNPSPPAPGDVDTPPTKTPKEKDPVASGAAGAATGAAVSAVSDLANKLMSSKNPADVFIGKVMDNAKRQGENAEQLQIELGEREVLISQLLISIPEPLLAKYFDEFLFQKDIPWTATREFMQKAINAEKQGSSARDVLDFALVFYDKRRNYGNTLYIIDTALDLQPSMRNVNIFQYLKESLQGIRKTGLNFLLLGPENLDNAIVLNKLMGMVLARGSEDIEALRREYQKSKDQLQRKREVADRFRGIYDIMMSMEFQSALKRNVQFVTEQFALSANDPEVQSFARILYDIKLGQQFRSEIFASLEGRQTAEKSPGLAEQNARPSTRTTSTNLKFVKAQVAQTKLNPEFVKNFTNYIIRLQQGASGLLMKCENPKPNEKQLADEVKGLISSANINFTDAIRLLKSQNINFKDVYDLYYAAMKKFSTVDSIQKQYASTTTAKTDATNFRFAQNPVNTPPGVAVNVTGDSSGAGGGNGKFLSDEAAKVANTIFKGTAAGVGVIAFTAFGDLKTALAAGTALYLQQKNENALKIAKEAGIEPPVDETPQYVLEDAAEALKALGANDLQQKEFLANDQFISQVEATVNAMERRLVLVIDAQVKTADSNVETPLESPEKVDKLYRDFMAYLRQANQYCSRQIDLVNFITKNSKNPTVKMKLGSINQYQAKVGEKVETVRSKISEYASLTEIISNVQSQKFLLVKIKELMPQLEKYLSTGLSVADVLGSEGGVLDKIKQYIDLEKDSYFKLFKKWQDLVAKFPNLNFNAANAPETLEGQSQVNVPTSVAPTTTVSEGVSVQGTNTSEGGDLVGYQRSASLQFSNLMFEKNVKVAAVDPQQQAKYNYYINRMKDPNINLQSLVRALDSDATFTDAGLKLLARNAILQKSVSQFGASLTQRPAYEGSYTNDQGQPVAPPNQQTTQPVGQTVNQPATPPQGAAGVGSTTPGRELSTPAELSLYTDVKNAYKDIEIETKNYGILPSADTLDYDPKRMIASMRAQLQKVFEKIQGMQTIYYKLLQNPQDFGGIIPALRTNSANKFLKLAKFEKVENLNQESKEVESDQRFRDYWDKELGYGPWGTTVDEKPEHSDKTYEEEKKLHPQRTSKFKKI
jgi:hypothetical protein